MFWLTIVGTALTTYALRASCIVVAGKRTIPPALQPALRLLPAAILSALVFPQLFRLQGSLLSGSVSHLLAALLAALVAWRTRSALWTISVGMGSLWLLQGLAGFR